MLEKIGLPAKPSMRGANWVIDASHCQGCSSQFSFINRKHHCRRCGGLFCNSCTQQRMVLRGQGDSPVRICDPCKKLEDAARFEQRYGHRNRAKGSSKQVSKNEDDILVEILGTDGKHSAPSRKESHAFSDVLNENNAAHASSSAVFHTSGGEGDKSSYFEGPNDPLIDTGSSSPEDLRRQAMEEKRRYKILKAEGKAEEALKAFKHGKELERQAGALEIAIRKNRRMASKVSNSSSRVSTGRMDDLDALSNKKKQTSKDKEQKDDLFTELRELGWSDSDLHDTDKKPAKVSLEHELSFLQVKTQKSEISRKKSGIDNSQVVAHKRKALLLKREGKLAEAKEELKQAKILEKQLEEQELLGEASGSEDELSTLIHDMDDDNQETLLLGNNLDAGINFESLLGSADDLPTDVNFEVTDDDMNDPELSAALKSFGWSEEGEVCEADHASNLLDPDALRGEVLNLKKAALSQKRAGNVPEAMALLNKAKLLEQELETMQSETQKSGPECTQKRADHKIPASKSKMTIQKELLVLKKKALALRREGRVEEADEELKKGMVLEKHLEEIENDSKKHSGNSVQKSMERSHVQVGHTGGSLVLGEEDAETDVTEQDMHDPLFLSVLKNLGWNDDDESDHPNMKNKASIPSSNESGPDGLPSEIPWKLKRSKADIQRELLAIKRKALALRRQGKTDEAEEELERAKNLEKQMAELESRSSGPVMQNYSHDDEDTFSKKLGAEEVRRPISLSMETNKINFEKSHEILPGVLESGAESSKDQYEVPEKSLSVDPQPGQESNIGGNNNARNDVVSDEQASLNIIRTEASRVSVQQDQILAHKRNALALKREGKLTEAKEELRKAKLLEKSFSDEESGRNEKATSVSTSESSSVAHESKRFDIHKPISGRDRFKMQQESLTHKRNALKLRREGKIAEAEAEFEKAKELENQLEVHNAQGSNSNAIDAGVVVEDLLDPQLMSALKSIGWDDKDLISNPLKHEAKSAAENIMKDANRSRLSRTNLEEQIKSEKLRALNLKRAGNQDEALEALRSVKKLEKKLLS
ncbi:1-phosphatidylinositol-3-phosphate 5-kinase FAB1B [Apostasia shenzhenica]|uniref:1-phosphatidylinositol-3-phosphate 5-kinase FAB1B n=1 Tax=Apostasia shenzhenica TaxID=1088818 RepID=A0A2I0A584_9ASPA|nr:1-phosphatidylinositol-3-phosphate 5-kinase FAB1B [Apostasia shenzhenica]